MRVSRPHGSWPLTVWTIDMLASARGNANEVRITLRPDWNHFFDYRIVKCSITLLHWRNISPANLALNLQLGTSVLLKSRSYILRAMLMGFWCRFFLYFSWWREVVQVTTGIRNNLDWRKDNEQIDVRTPEIELWLWNMNLITFHQNSSRLNVVGT